MVRVDFVTLFPEVILAGARHSVLGRAEARGLVSFRTANPRDYCYDRHLKVDDAPFGGEPGMLLKAEPVALALESLGLGAGSAVISTEPAGVPFRQQNAAELSSLTQIVFLCGHYEGIDDRVIEKFATHRFSIGDYVLTNGELPALVMADAIVRLLPGVLGDPQSLEADSHSDGLLSAPNYTRPEEWRGVPVPEVLRSGDHRALALWRRETSLRLTQERRPDLLSSAELTKADLLFLNRGEDGGQ